MAKDRLEKAYKINRKLSCIAVSIFDYRNKDIDSKKLKNIISDNFKKILKELE